MSECQFRAADGECLRERAFPYKEFCVDGPCPHYTAQTNADRIRAMTDEELAEFITNTDFCELLCFGESICKDGRCDKKMLDWLKQEATDDP